MNYNVTSDVARIKETIEEFKLNGERESNNQKSMMLKSQKILMEFECHLKTSIGILNTSTRENALRELKNLWDIVDDCDSRSIKINSIKNKIISINASITCMPIYEKKKAEKSSVDVHIAVFCDIDKPENSGPVAAMILNALKQNIPFITTRAMLRCADIISDVIEAVEIEKCLLAHESNWDIYQQLDPKYGEEFLVFLPKAVFPDKMGVEKLIAFDFTTAGTLLPISATSALEGPKKKTSVESFFNLFSNPPKANKIITLAGHGGKNSCGGLSSENYVKLHNFLENQNCKGLIITSCCSGGNVSQLNIPDDRWNGDAKYFNQQRPHAFPIIVHSLGDVYIKAQGENMSYCFEALKQFITTPNKAETLARLRKAFENVPGSKQKLPSNLIQAYLPHSGGVAGGFRPLDEWDRGFSLTYAAIKRAEISSAPPFARANPKDMSSKVASIVVKDREFLELLLLSNNICLHYENANCVPISMMAGNAHHYIKEIQLAKKEQKSPLEYIRKCIDFYSKYSLNQVNKGFYIGEISSEASAIFDVVLYFDGKKTRLTWREGANYFFMDERNSIQSITPLMHTMLCRQIERATMPQEKATRSATAGQQSHAQFQEALERACFSSSPLFGKLFVQDKNTLKPAENFSQIIRRSNLTPEEKQALFFFLLEQAPSSNREETVDPVELAFQLLKAEKIDPNSKNWRGFPLLFYASNHSEIIAHLLKLPEIDINAMDSEGRTLLHIATSDINNRSLIDALLAHPNIDTSAKDRSGWSPIAAALRDSPPDAKTFHQLLSKNPDLLDELNPITGLTLLSYFASINKQEQVDLLLKEHANPNKGKPSPLVQAIHIRNKELTLKLLKAGAQPFKQDESGSVAFIEALLHAPEIGAIFLKCPDCDSGISDKRGYTPLLAALFSGNLKNIDLLQKTKAPFPMQLDESKSMLQAILYRQEKLGNLFSFASEVLHLNNHSSLEFEFFIGNYLLTDRDAEGDVVFRDTYLSNERKLVLKQIIAEDLIDLNLPIDDTSIFLNLCKQLCKCSDLNEQKDVLKLCLDHGADIYGSINGESALSIAAQSGHRSFMKLLLENCSFSKIENKNEILNTIINNDDLELLQLAVAKGAEINKIRSVLPPLQRAARNLKIDSNGDVLKWLVEQGEDLNRIGIAQRTPYEEVVLSGNAQLIAYCLAHGAKPR